MGLASDVLLTDYSSVMFDYANLRRPIVLFVPDRERYADAIRGFYFDLEEVPGPLCSTTDEVVEELTHVEGHRTKYEQAYAAFVEKFCPLDDGCACARVLERLARRSTKSRRCRPIQKVAHAGIRQCLHGGETSAPR